MDNTVSSESQMMEASSSSQKSRVTVAKSSASSVAAMEHKSSAKGTQASVAVSASAQVEVAPKPVTIQLSAQNWSWSPGVIKVKKGQKVTVVVQSLEGMHGISIPSLGISEKLSDGGTVTFTLPTDTAGTFEFFCNVPCGPGHKEMRGQIIISE